MNIKLASTRIVLPVLLFLFVSSLFMTVYSYQTPLELRYERPLYTYELKGVFNYNVTLYDNILYESNTLRNPDKVFLKLVDKLSVETTYFFNSKPTARIQDSSLIVEVYLTQQQAWSKNISRGVVQSQYNTLSYTLELDIPRLVAYARNISQSIELTGFRYMLIINCTATTTFTILNNTQRIVFPYSLQIVIDLTSRTMEFSRRESYQSGVQREFIVTENRINLGFIELPVGYWRRISILTSISNGLLFLLLTSLSRLKHKKPSPSRFSRTLNKYRSLIVDIDDNLEQSQLNVVRVKSLEDLVKVSQVLMKPILHVERSGSHVFTIADGDILFVYVGEENS